MNQAASVNQAQSQPDKPVAPWRPRIVERTWSLEVMMVEDDDADASLILHALRRNVHVRSVRAYTDGEAALDDLAAERARPDLILVDIQMPKMSGFQFVEALRETPALSDTQVVFLTTSRLSRDVERAQQSAACGYVIKPNTYHELHGQLDLTARRALKRLHPRGCR